MKIKEREIKRKVVTIKFNGKEWGIFRRYVGECSQPGILNALPDNEKLAMAFDNLLDEIVHKTKMI
jgi:hypothetical protein